MALGSVSGDVSLLVRYARVSLEIWLGLALPSHFSKRSRDPAHALVCVKFECTGVPHARCCGKPCFIRRLTRLARLDGTFGVA